MNEKITAHPSKGEREKVLKEIRQLENRKKILENKQRNEERRVRTRRLIERGAILEGVFPLTPDLSGAEVKAFLIALSHLPVAAELTANLSKFGLCRKALHYSAFCRQTASSLCSSFMKKSLI